MKDKTYAINGRSRGLVAIPLGEVPTGTRCIQMLIPDSDDALAMLAGAIYELTHWSNYQREAARKGTQWAQAWRTALLDSIPFLGCDMTKLRVDNICGLQWSYDNWATFDEYDPTACIVAVLSSEFGALFNSALEQAIADGIVPRNGVPGSPQEAPTPGTCVSYHVVLRANDQWVVPSPISGGDTLHITNWSGGWNDGAVYWYCPDGNSYGLGMCTPASGHTEPGDPIDTIDHMRIVGKLTSDDVWFDAQTGLYIVPSGATANQVVVLQANDSTLEDNRGEVAFDIEICRGGWHHVFDFRAGTSSYWTPHVFGGNTYAIYTAGVGYQVAFNYHAVALDTVNWPTALTSFTIEIELDRVPTGPDRKLAWQKNSSVSIEAWGDNASRKQDMSGAGVLEWVDFDDDLADGSGQAYTWPGAIQRIIVSSTIGVDPF